MGARGDPCRCRNCKCSNFTAEPKWFMCPPCAVGNHSGQPCSDFEQRQWQPDTCTNCGYDRIEHQGAHKVASTYPPVVHKKGG